MKLTTGIITTYNGTTIGEYDKHISRILLFLEKLAKNQLKGKKKGMSHRGNGFHISDMTSE